MKLLHKIEKSVNFAQCGRKFDNQRELKGHILSVHEGKKEYRCPICKACFAEASKLKRHIEPQRL